jgi:hypothetical protein
MMNTGMLWFDNTPQRPLSAKIEGAAHHYREKYGVSPTLCYVHPSALGHGEHLTCPIRVLSAADILPHHLWIGVGEADDAGLDAAAS